jgi:AcrR family transcriptional regulator
MIFAQQGFHGTSTREIARLADISEVTLYRHYENKEAVFLGALESSLDTITKRSGFLRKTGNTKPSEDVLPQILSLLHDVATYAPQAAKLIAIAYLEVHGLAEEMCSTRLGAIFKEITAYLNANMRTGRLRSIDPGLATAAMALSAVAQTGIQRFTPTQTGPRSKIHKTIDDFSAFWASVLIPKQDDLSADRDTDSSLLPETEATINAAKA